MPAKEIKELRQSGRLEEALNMAEAEREADPENIWTKRNLSWVYYDYLKVAIDSGSTEDVISWLDRIAELKLPETEEMLWGNLAWQIGKVGFLFAKEDPIDSNKALELTKRVESFHFSKPGEGFGFLFRGLHKLLKETEHYLRFADWCGFENFLPKDFEKEALSNGKEVMSFVEQVYITYAKHLLPRRTTTGEVLFDREKAEIFLGKLKELTEKHPAYQYPPYFQAKILLALGNRGNILEALLPFARKKRNDFWVWEVISEAFFSDSEKVFACYCRALLCPSPEEMLVSLRQKFARMLVQKQLYDEAKTEITKILEVKRQKGHKTSPELNGWILETWYQLAQDLKTNNILYQQYASVADSILYQDVPEELVFVEFVNKGKKMINFIASESKFGYFKYDRFLSSVSVGDILRVRLQSVSTGGIHQVFTLAKVDNAAFRDKFIREVRGVFQIVEGKSFGLVGNIYVPQTVIEKDNLKDKSEFSGTAIKSYNPVKKQWGWKVVSIK